jgi:hypothetical protein
MTKPDIYPVHLISKSDVPKEAEELFKTYGSISTMEPDISLSEFDHFFRIESANVTSYVAEHEKHLAIGTMERTSYIVDVDHGSPKVLGVGEMRLETQERVSMSYTRTYSGYRETTENYQRKGYGLRRLRALNLAAHILYELPLHSDTNMAPASIRLWRHLVENNLAEEYSDGNRTRFRFRNTDIRSIYDV